MTLCTCASRWQLFVAQPTPQGGLRRRGSRRRLGARAQGPGSEPDGGSSSGQEAPPSASRPAATPAAAPTTPPLGDPSRMVVYGGRLPPARRLIVSGLTATAIALGANFLGVTSALLSLDGGRLAESSRLDVLVPVNGSRRCLDTQNGYTFLYPANWLADQTLYRRYAERIERQAALDPPSLRRARARQAGVPEPTAAFGPAGSTGEENISVVVAPIRDGFTLQRMGTPEEAGTRFLETTVAPEGSGKTAVLLGAGSRRDASGELYYWQEFTVESQRPRFFRHNLAVYAARNGLLYTLNCQCSEERWAANAAAFRKSADSFTILNSGAATAGFPDRI